MLIAGAGVTQNAATAVAASASTGRPILPKGAGGWSSNPQPQGSTFAWKAPAGHTTEHPAKTDPHAKRVKELTTRRTADASFFQMSDGSVQEELSAAPVHYQAAHGVWQNIDATVRPLSHNGFTAGAVGDTFHTYFSGDAETSLSIESAQVTSHFTLQQRASRVSATPRRLSMHTSMRTAYMGQLTGSA